MASEGFGRFIPKDFPRRLNFVPCELPCGVKGERVIGWNVAGCGIVRGLSQPLYFGARIRWRARGGPSATSDISTVRSERARALFGAGRLSSSATPGSTCFRFLAVAAGWIRSEARSRDLEKRRPRTKPGPCVTKHETITIAERGGWHGGHLPSPGGLRRVSWPGSA